MSVADKLAQFKNEKANNNLAIGEQFLAENKQKPNIVTTDSGLQYEIVTLGEGPKPNASNTVTCHYEGSLLDGTVFDSSYKRGMPASFPLSMVIKGWTEGLQYMPKGSTFIFYIHPNLAYGTKQAGAHIQPNSTLVFKVELIDFK